MFDSLFNKKSGQNGGSTQSKAPIQPQKNTTTSSSSSASAPTGPLEVGRDAMGADFQSIVDEAAIVYAGGEEKTAAEMLIDFLKQTNGQANRKVWFMLLDIYQALNQKDQYEKLSLMFANRFGTSPPSWEEALGEYGGSVNPPVNKNMIAGGKNVLIIEGSAADQLSSKSKEFISSSREMKSCKLDISRIKMDLTSLEGINALHNVMSMLRRYKVSATLMGENHVASWLEKKIASTKDRANLNDSPYWMLLLEILQWRGLMDAFEELSLEYTITFEVSGPGWEPSGVMTIEAVSEPAEEMPISSDAKGDIVPDEVITDISIQRMQDMIMASMNEMGKAKLDFRRVKRMDFSAAGTFLNLLGSLGDRSKNVMIINPSELILALGDVVGFVPYLTVNPRKR